MANYGIKVTLDGYDVASATDRQLALKSEIALQKVVVSGSTTVAYNAVGSVTHNLGYIPQFLVFGEDPNNANNMNIGNASYLYSGVIARADTTKVYWDVDAGSGTFDIYYYVFYDQI